MTLGRVPDLVRHRAFDQLLGIRLCGQLADGLMQAGLVGVVLFAPERGASPARIAIGFAVLLVPFTVLAPLAGVILDTWSRVALLRWANVARAGLVAVTAAATAVRGTELLVFGSALIALALNRLVLAALGASLPRTIPKHLLVSGNSLAPTLGALTTVIGGGLGLALRGALDGYREAAPFVASSIGYLLAAAVSATFSGRALGPRSRHRMRSPLRRARVAVRVGVQQVRHSAAARWGLQMTTLQRMLFGALTVWSIILIRFTHPVTRSSEPSALAALGAVALAGGVGLVAASVVTPHLIRRQGVTRAVTGGMTIAAVGCLAPVVALRLGTVLVTWFLVAFGAQTLKIAIDTVLQRAMPDRLRGRVFIAYDLAFNLAFVAGVAAVAVLPLRWLGYAVLPGVVAAGYAVLAVVAARSRQRHWAE